MKFLLILALVAAVAQAELQVFLGSKEIKFDEETLKKLDVNQVTITKVAKDADNIRDFVPPMDIQFGGENEVEGKNIVDDKIIALLKGIGEQMGEGWPELGIPPLDPFRMEQYNMSFGVPLLFKATLKLSDISAVGLQKTIIEKINFNIIRLTFACAFDLPEFVYDSNFDLNGKITLVVPFHIGGGFRMKLKHFKLQGQMSLGTTPDGYLTLKTMVLNLSVEKTTIHFDGILGSGPLNDIMNWLLNLFTNGFIKDQVEKLGEVISVILFEVLNEALGKINLADLIG